MTNALNLDNGFEAVSQVFENKLQQDLKFREKVAEGICASLEKAGLEAPPTETTTENIRLGETLDVAAGPVITAAAFWWGYHFVIPEAVMKEFSKVSDVFAAFMAYGGSLIAASGGTLASLVAIVAAYVSVQLVLMQAVNQGKGVYLSATWISPVILVSTPIT
ncbi:hypothetical protein [Lyngbya sp. PCC 8106]|uniref:hypothetical protein n=1 Tax=Lyngbya sp. (strain PCC 8106) TaxID=313612 RepID=UPI0000EAD7B3|nr:hypothetical protein [Lyngbya sp. PCC 8106]EAW36439.1 hypothetical protein L8106_23960 [Lyngbya sp. PCC 8106]